jgi:hypothetical protein
MERKTNSNKSSFHKGEINCHYSDFLVFQSMASSMRSRKNGASGTGTQDAESPGGISRSRISDVLSIRKALSVVGAILFYASLIFRPAGNIGLSAVNWRWSSTTAEEWNDRREQVKDAFVSSWGAYTKYAWGESALS